MPAPLEGTRWELCEIRGAALELDAGATAPYLVLDAAERRLVGSGGCNRLFGAYERDADALRFSLLGTTRMACADPVMRREAAFLEALESATRFEVDAGSLVLFAGAVAVARLMSGTPGAPGRV